MTRRGVIESEDVLSILRNGDRYFEEVLATVGRVKIFDYDMARGWVAMNDGEGALYLVKRAQSPFYKFVIINKRNKFGIFRKITDIPLSQHCLIQSFQQYYMLKNDTGQIQAVMFPSKNDCDNICQKVEGIMKEVKKTVQSNFKAPVSGALRDKTIVETPMKADTSNYDDNKIFNLLESAKLRYNSVNMHREPVFSNSSDKSRQIDINELFTQADNTRDIRISQPSPLKIVSTMDMASSHNASGPTPTRVMSFDLTDDNTAIAFTVTELENYFVNGASSVEEVKESYAEGDSDDDIQLLNPHNFINGNLGDYKHQVMPELSREQFKETLLHILQNTDEDGGLFLSRLHSVYLDLCQKTLNK